MYFLQSRNWKHLVIATVEYYWSYSMKKNRRQ